MRTVTRPPAPAEVVERWDRNASDRLRDLVDGRDMTYPLLLQHVAQVIRRTTATRGTALDVGCGLGSSTRILRDLGFVAFGIDPSPRSIAIAQRRFGGHYRVGTLETVRKPPNGFSLVTFTMVLHAVGELDQIVRQCAHRLAANGVAIVAIPDPRTYLVRKPYFSHAQFDYSDERCFEVPFVRAGDVVHREQVFFFHRPVSSYTAAFSRAGLRVTDVVKPASEQDALADVVCFVLRKATRPRVL